MSSTPTSNAPAPSDDEEGCAKMSKEVKNKMAVNPSLSNVNAVTTILKNPDDVVMQESTVCGEAESQEQFEEYDGEEDEYAWEYCENDQNNCEYMEEDDEEYIILQHNQVNPPGGAPLNSCPSSQQSTRPISFRDILIKHQQGQQQLPPATIPLHATQPSRSVKPTFLELKSKQRKLRDAEAAKLTCVSVPVSSVSPESKVGAGTGSILSSSHKPNDAVLESEATTYDAIYSSYKSLAVRSVENTGRKRLTLSGQQRMTLKALQYNERLAAEEKARAVEMNRRSILEQDRLDAIKATMKMKMKSVTSSASANASKHGGGKGDRNDEVSATGNHKQKRKQ
jgi:hypothetical protein